MPDFFHITITPSTTEDESSESWMKEMTSKYAAVEKTLSLAISWFKYDMNAYVIYTDKDVGQWFSLLKSYVEGTGNLFICKLDINHAAGHSDGVFWKWIERYKNIHKYEEGEHIFMWADDPAQAVMGTVTSVGPNGMPKVKTSGFQTWYAPGTNVNFSKIHPTRGIPADILWNQINAAGLATKVGVPAVNVENKIRGKRI